MNVIYDLKVGEVFAICGYNEAFTGRYKVEKIIEQVAVCLSENGQARLMLPLYVPIPFAVLVGQETRKVPTPKPVAPEVVPETSVSAKLEAPETRQIEPEPAAVAVEKQRKTGVIEYYNVPGHWGKISHPVFRKGIFFYISQVTDEALKAKLDALTPADETPHLAVNYEQIKNPRRFNAVCAGDIRLEELQPDAQGAKPSAEPVPASGYITSYIAGKGAIMQGNVDDKIHFRDADVKDPCLLTYLQKYVTPGTIDSIDIKVDYLRANKRATEIVWTNMDEVKGVEVEALKSEAYVANEEEKAE